MTATDGASNKGSKTFCSGTGSGTGRGSYGTDSMEATQPLVADSVDDEGAVVGAAVVVVVVTVVVAGLRVVLGLGGIVG